MFIENVSFKEYVYCTGIRFAEDQCIVSEFNATEYVTAQIDMQNYVNAEIMNCTENISVQICEYKGI